MRHLITIFKFWGRKVVNRLKNEFKKTKRLLFEEKYGFTVMLGLTYFCQCTCSHCGIGIYKKDKEREFTTNEWLEIINNLPKKTKWVVFFGGEPLLRKDLLDLISRAKMRKFQTIVQTNGYLLTEEMIKNLKKSGLDLIEVSIDNSDPKIHDSLRGVEGIFEIAILGIKNCLKENIPCGISTYATKENIDNGNLRNVILLSKELKVNYLRILSPILTGKWLKADELKLNNDERKHLKSFMKKDFPFLEDDHCFSKNKKLVYISPYGEVQPCCYNPFSFGNIKEESLEKIMNRMWQHPMYKIKTKQCIINNEEFRKKYIKDLELSQEFPINLNKNFTQKNNQ